MANFLREETIDDCVVVSAVSLSCSRHDKEFKTAEFFVFQSISSLMDFDVGLASENQIEAFDAVFGAHLKYRRAEVFNGFQIGFNFAVHWMNNDKRAV